jgi:hypothetical protein
MPWSLTDMVLGWDRTLVVAAVLILGLMAPTLLALMVDGRTLNGIPVWIKPLKFQLSVGLYLLTLAWLFGALPEPAREGRAARILKRVALATAAFEIAYITLQAGQGLASHYNVGDAFHRLMYALMGVAAVALTAVSPGLAVLLARHRPRHWSAAFRLSVVLGLVLTFVLGAGAGAVLSAGDGHWIGGVRTDLGGVPVLGWSRTGGDLRIAHFLGIHALQLIPVAGLVAEARFGERGAARAVWAIAAAYGLITVLVFHLALRGLPLIPA